MKNNKKLLGMVIAFFIIMVMVGISGCTSGSADDDDDNDNDDNDVNDLIAAYCSVEYGAQSDNVAYATVSLLKTTYDIEGLS